MNNESDIRAYLRALFEAPITILFVILDIVGAVTFFIWVVDDWGEGLVVLGFILVLHIGHYYVFKKQRQIINELSNRIDSFKDSSPKLSLQFLENNIAKSHLTIKVLPVPPEPDYDDLLAWEEKALDELYEVDEDADMISKLAMSAMEVAGGGRKNRKRYKDECAQYLEEFREYLEKDFYFKVKENRLRSLNFQVGNFEGKTLARDIVIVIKFPEELLPVQDDQYTNLVLFDYNPKPPRRPSATTNLFSDMMTRDGFRFMDMPTITPAVDVLSKSIRGPYVDNREVRFEVDKLLHNFSENFDGVFLLIRDEHVQRIWEIEYSIHAAELPTPRTGTLLLEIQTLVL